MIERLSKAMSMALVCINFLPIPSKLSFHMRKIIHRHGPKFISHKNLLTLELSQYHKSDSTFSSTEPVAANSNYTSD